MAINPAEITTIRVGELPVGSITLTSKLAVENGTDLEQVTGQDVVDFINVNSNAFQFEVRDLWVNQAYIDTNFDGTGLGILLMDGWAICNGQNGTPPMDGLVSIGYGNNYGVIGAFGGSKDAVVVEHTHTFIGSEDNTPEPGSYICTNDDGSTGVQSSLSTTGVSGTNKNMQPYIVLLKIMKL
jgi:hypothetical protein